MLTPYGERLMMPAEVAILFGVDARTVGRWAREGKLAFVKTPGGHHRFLESVVLQVFRESAHVRRVS